MWRFLQRYINNAQHFPKGQVIFSFWKVVWIFKLACYLEYSCKEKHWYRFDVWGYSGVEWFSRSLCTTGLTELLWFVWCLFVCFTVKNPTLARKILLRVTVAEKQLEPWSPRSNSKLIPYNWEQKWLFSFWVAAELAELVISAEGSIPCAHHPSVFTQQLLIFCLI